MSAQAAENKIQSICLNKKNFSPQYKLSETKQGSGSEQIVCW